MSRLRRPGFLPGIAALLLAVAAGCREAPPKPRPPALAVLIAVDQLRADLLDRYDTLFSGGFRRLRDRGMHYTRAMVDHAITVSHPGHVTLATGLVPARHGIVDAAFFVPEGDHRRLVDALEDPNERILGAPGQKGVSPRKILASTLPEWFIRADPEARAAALGSGQYSSLLHDARAGGDVYWYSGAAGRYVTSTYYRREYPAWIDRFNGMVLPRLMEGSALWESTVPPAGRPLALPDASPYEADHVHTTFPHRLEERIPPEHAADLEYRRRALAWWIAGTPALDGATLALARETVAALSLGGRGRTDYLSLVLSQVDDIGHSYGPLSQEQLDNLLRLDRELGEFFSFLDASVGKGRYVIALSADHGIPDIPESRRETGRAGRRVTEEEIEKVLKEAKIAASAGPGSPDEIAARVAGAVERHDFVADAMTPTDLAGGAGGSDPFIALYRNSWRPDRVPRLPLFSFSGDGTGIGQYGVAVRLVEGAMIDLDPAVHGSPYEYDRHVPLIFMGEGIGPGVSDEEARTVDLAPTLARLSGIPFPSGLDGRPLLQPSSGPSGD